MLRHRHSVRIVLGILATAAAALAGLSGGCPADPATNPGAPSNPVVAGDSAVNDGGDVPAGGGSGGGTATSTSGGSSNGGGGAGAINAPQIVVAGWMNEPVRAVLVAAADRTADMTFELAGEPSPSGAADLFANPGADVTLVYTPVDDFVGDAAVTVNIRDGAASGTAIVRFRVLPKVEFALDRYEGEAPAGMLASATIPSGHTLPEDVELHWSFGDGSAATDPGTNMNRTHVFNNPGVYLVSLALLVGGVSGELGCTHASPGPAHFTARERSGGAGTNQPPIAAAGADQNVIDEDGNGFALVTLSGGASSDPDGEIVAYTWTVEGGATYGPHPTPSTAISLGIGTWNITLTVMDNGGATASDALRVVVGSSAILAISPDTPLSASGVMGGPFSPGSQEYTITNSGDAPLTWSAAHGQGWISLSSAGGTLAAGASTTVTVSINSLANSFLAGSYGDTITFTNTASGAVLTRAVELSVVPAGGLLVSAGSLTSAGLVGGPFSPTSRNYTLTNTGGSAITWTATKTRPWVTLSSAGGTLAAGGTAVVTVSLNSQANSLPAAVHSDTVSFANTTNGMGNTTRAVSLTVTAPAALSVTGTDLAASGPPGGPFSPASTTYTLTNSGGVSLNWTAGGNQAWLTVAPTSGTLAAGASATVTVSINSSANALAADSYTALLTLTNVTNGVGNTTRNEGLTVTTAPNSLLPGSGFGGPTQQPSTVGSGSGSDAKVIAKWDTVPYQTFSQVTYLGVVAFHINGIDRVEFSANGGPWVTVRNMSLNPATGVWDYWVSIDPADCVDGPVEVRAIAYPIAGIPRVLGDDNTTFVGTCQAGSTTTQIRLGAGASAVDDFYKNMLIDFLAGPAGGEVGLILSYTGATRTATIQRPVSVAPTAATTYSIQYERSMQLYANGTGGLMGATKYVSVSGNDNWPGTRSQPYATILKGLNSAGEGGEVVILTAGRWSVDRNNSGYPNYQRWVTVRPDDGLSPYAVTIDQGGFANALSPNVPCVHWKNLAFDYASLSSIEGSCNLGRQAVWIEGCKLYNSDGLGAAAYGRTNIPYPIRTAGPRVWGYITDSIVQDLIYGLNGMDFVRNCTQTHIGGDALTGTKCALNNITDSLMDGEAACGVEGPYFAGSGTGTMIKNAIRYTGAVDATYVLSVAGSSGTGFMLNWTKNGINQTPITINSSNRSNVPIDLGLTVSFPSTLSTYANGDTWTMYARSWHQDTHQYFGNSENVIVYGHKDSNIRDIQNFYIDQSLSSHTNMAFVNIAIENVMSTRPGPPFTQLRSRCEHLLFLHVSNPKQLIILVNDPWPEYPTYVFAPNNVLFQNCILERVSPGSAGWPSSGIDFRHCHFASGIPSGLNPTIGDVTIQNGPDADFSYTGSGVPSISGSGLALPGLSNRFRDDLTVPDRGAWPFR